MFGEIRMMRVLSKDQTKFDPSVLSLGKFERMIGLLSFSPILRNDESSKNVGIYHVGGWNFAAKIWF